MNPATQARQLGRIPRLHLTIQQISSRNKDDKRLTGLWTELGRRMMEVRAFSMTPEGKGFEEVVNKAVRAVTSDTQ